MDTYKIKPHIALQLPRSTTKLKRLVQRTERWPTTLAELMSVLLAISLYNPEYPDYSLIEDWIKTDGLRLETVFEYEQGYTSIRLDDYLNELVDILDTVHKELTPYLRNKSIRDILLENIDLETNDFTLDPVTGVLLVGDFEIPRHHLGVYGDLEAPF